MRLHLVVCLILCGVCTIAAEDSVNADVVNVKVQRTVDLNTHLAKIVNRITLENGGKTAVRSYLFAVEPDLAKSVSFIGATVRISAEIGSCLLNRLHYNREFVNMQNNCKFV